jgi:hypothetical protein
VIARKPASEERRIEKALGRLIEARQENARLRELAKVPRATKKGGRK